MFRRHPKTDDQTFIRLVYYFCNGISTKAAAKALGLSRKSVRAHYLDLRARLRKSKFRRWHHVYTALPNVSDLQADQTFRGAFLEALAVCHDSRCRANYAKGNRASRFCRRCPLPHAFSSSASAQEAVGIVDAIYRFYYRLGIREDDTDDKLGNFFECFLHTSVIATLRETSKRIPNGLFDPSDMDFHGLGTLMVMLLDDLADDNLPRLDDIGL